MDRKEVKELIQKTVMDHGGMKVTELATIIGIELGRRQLDISFPDLVEEMVKDGHLVEVEYVLPVMTYRVKSFLLPGGTAAEIRPDWVPSPKYL